jgi:two-component system LytT family response regulator
MISCVIIDDEKKSRNTIEKIVERYLSSKLKVVYSAGSVKEGASAIQKYHPDLVFLDIGMPGEDGFKLFEYFDKVPCEVVFLSAVQNYAIKAIKRSAFDYLLKPLDHVELENMITHFENKKQEEKNSLHA